MRIGKQAVQKLTTEIFDKLQQSQEGRVILNIGSSAFRPPSDAHDIPYLIV